jgi:hypothetical protein
LERTPPAAAAAMPGMSYSQSKRTLPASHSGPEEWGGGGQYCSQLLYLKFHHKTNLIYLNCFFVTKMVLLQNLHNKKQ